MFGLYPSEFNYAGPGKRPLSSITPTIIERDNKLEIVIGGSGGSMIPTATLNVSHFRKKTIISKLFFRVLSILLIMEKIFTVL
jgi:hypothetical protein